MKRVLSVLLSVSMIFGAVTAAAVEDEEKEIIIAFEAEDGLLNQNFKTADSEFASGAKFIESAASRAKTTVTAQSDADAEYKFETDTAGEYFLYIRCIAPNNIAKNLFAAVDNNGYSICASKKSLYWVWQKVNLGIISGGQHTIRLIAGDKGFEIDRLVVTNLKKYNPDDSLKPTPVPSEEPVVNYLESKPAFEKPDIYEAKENVPGSFLFEAEDGKIVSPMSVYDDKTASGGKYIAAVTGSKKLK